MALAIACVITYTNFLSIAAEFNVTVHMFVMKSQNRQINLLVASSAVIQVSLPNWNHQVAQNFSQQHFALMASDPMGSSGVPPPMRYSGVPPQSQMWTLYNNMHMAQGLPLAQNPHQVEPNLEEWNAPNPNWKMLDASQMNQRNWCPSIIRIWTSSAHLYRCDKKEIGGN